MARRQRSPGPPGHRDDPDWQIPEWWDSWSEEERLAWHERLEEFGVVEKLEAELRTLVPADVFATVSEYGDHKAQGVYATMSMMIGRLQRILPGLADVIDWAGFNGTDWHP